MSQDKRFPASQAARLDNPERLAWLPPGEVIDALAVHTGETIADVGAGTGYFTLPLSSAVGAAGKVYAIDGQSEMLAWIKLKLERAEFPNVELTHAEAEHTGLPASSCDLFFLANLWHEIEDRAAVLFEATRVLKRGGRIAILDWRTDVEPVAGPPLAHRISPTHALGEVRLAGFEQLAFAEVGRYSWLVQGEKVQ
ncbi:MAG: methyltransferase domain-containing protein [Terracidiphilus sp.]